MGQKIHPVGMRLGIDRLSFYGTKLGLGHKTGIDLPSEEPGLMPSAEWVERVFHRKWYAGIRQHPSRRRTSTGCDSVAFFRSNLL